VFTVQVSNSLGSVMSNPAALAIGSTPRLIPTITTAVNAASSAVNYSAETGGARSAAESAAGGLHAHLAETVAGWLKI
jgi:hypothetical protein